MKILIFFVLLVLIFGCAEQQEELIILRGAVIGKNFRPPSGGIFGGSSQLIVYFKTDDGIYYEIHVDPLYYELTEGDRVQLVCRKDKFYKYLRGDGLIVEDSTLKEWEFIEEGI